jgi:hypothetical protein
MVVLSVGLETEKQRLTKGRSLGESGTESISSSSKPCKEMILSNNNQMSSPIPNLCNKQRNTKTLPHHSRIPSFPFSPILCCSIINYREPPSFPHQL